MSLFAQHRSGPFPEPVVPAFPGQPIFRGAAPTVDQALRLSAVWACVRLLSDAVAMMPMETFDIGKDGQRKPIAPGALLKKPSADATRAEWIQMIVVSLLLRGNAYGQIVARDRLGLPTQIELVHPDSVGVRVDTTTGQLAYTVNAATIDRKDVFHVRGMRLPGVPQGLSPISYAARTLQTEAAAQAFGQGFFEDGAHPSAILATESQVSPENAQVIKDRFKAAVQGRDVAVLGAGVKYNAIQVNPEESQFLATQQFGVAQIARIFGVPPEMIGGASGDSMTYSNVTQRSLDFLTYSVQPWLTRLEDAIFPLIPGATHVRFNTSTLVRMTATDRWNVNRTKLLLGAATLNEVRSEEGESPVAWGNEPYLPSFATAAAMQEVMADEAKEIAPVVPAKKGATK